MRVILISSHVQVGRDEMFWSLVTFSTNLRLTFRPLRRLSQCLLSMSKKSGIKLLLSLGLMMKVQRWNRGLHWVVFNSVYGNQILQKHHFRLRLQISCRQIDFWWPRCPDIQLKKGHHQNQKAISMSGKMHCYIDSYHIILNILSCWFFVDPDPSALWPWKCY